MKKTEENRYPNSAMLFKFCKQALELRHDGNAKVIDQDVGSILGYDPADCSHWKKGKKNIRSLSTLRSIADHLSVDERLLISIASGKVGLEEAIFEYRGYGAFGLTGKHLDALKKEFFRNPTHWTPEGGVTTFEELFDVDRPAIAKLADAVLSSGKFTEAPIYVPELYEIYSNVKLVADAQMTEAVDVRVAADATTPSVVRYRGPEMRPYVRFLLVKELFKHLCRMRHPAAARFLRSAPEVIEIQSNIFAGMVLIPGRILRAEVEGIDSSLDIVSQLADMFWVSTALMNQRLRDYMEHLN